MPTAVKNGAPLPIPGSVKLAALRAILSDMMAVSQFAGLEQRITEIEE